MRHDGKGLLGLPQCSQAFGAHAEGALAGGAVGVLDQAGGLERRRARAVAASRRAGWGQALSRRMLGRSIHHLIVELPDLAEVTHVAACQ